jgi:RNA polymerase sigma-70 factor (ECF subfamily)
MFFKTNNSNEGGDDPVLGHIDGLYSYAFVLTRNRTDAEDLVQETYLRALPAKGRLRDDSNVKSWLFTILRNVWLNQLRQKRSMHAVDSLDVEKVAAEIPSGGFEDPHSLLVSKLDREQVREAIQRLPLDFREIILLREYGELSYQEIAKMLRCPIGTVMSRLGRARSKLRSLLSAASDAPQLRQGRADA